MIRVKIGSVPRLSAKIMRQDGLQVSLKNLVIVSDKSDRYTGPYEVTPQAFSGSVLSTRDKLLEDDVKVLSIPFYEVSNSSGKTAVIG